MVWVRGMAEGMMWSIFVDKKYFRVDNLREALEVLLRRGYIRRWDQVVIEHPSKPMFIVTYGDDLYELLKGEEVVVAYTEEPPRTASEYKYVSLTLDGLER